MPGRTPQEAVQNYIDPLKRAVGCLDGYSQIFVADRVGKVGSQGAWMLNGPEGMELKGFGTLFAEQRFELVETDPERFDISVGRFRISTRMYNYKLVREAEGIEIRWHWHPVGNSHEFRPHIHPSFNLKAHMPSPRYSLEEIVESCISLGARPSCEDWQSRLLETDGIHKLYRTWSNDPTEQQPHRV
ncbi:hypothetical protein OHB26_03265 [Nocardia sp. NBC_01503]|uniref:hypothetical protein n=1 Tax=Nocardia sp. NBC_01503 TaxID=2975997 RepID=UPI002E7C0672|nr:hypothetical protein [Nocardia sp. NBC_01503]WTL33284.1 hypothetical protein OHB26_03265 [Nocardia sp. NBC_01503]